MLHKLHNFDELLDKDGSYDKMIEHGLEMDGDAIAAKLQRALLTLPEKQRPLE